MPCIATLFMIARELGRKAALIIAAIVTALAFGIGGLVHQLAHWIGL
jgi:Fe2+ transport system protein B